MNNSNHPRIKKKSKPKKLLNRKKSDPGVFVFTGQESDAPIEMQLFAYNEQNYTENRQISSMDELKDFSDEASRYWLNVHGLGQTETIARVCKKLHIHPLVIQDILDVNQRPKYQEFEHFGFFTLKTLMPENAFATEQISFVFSSNFLVSFQERKAVFFEHIRQRIRENKGIIRSRGIDYLLYTLLESILDNYFKALEKLETEVEQLNNSLFKTDASPATIESIELYKKQLLLIKKAIQPIKEFTAVAERGEVPQIEKQQLKYYFEIKDLCLTLLDNCDTLERTLDSSTNLFFSLQGHRLNQIMKILTIVATIFIPLTFIAGIYGMNFTHMPELEWRYGYIGVWAVMLFIIAGMLVYLKKRKWF